MPLSDAQPLTRLPVLLAVSCLGTGGALLAGRALLGMRPPLTPDWSSGRLERVWRWSPDPQRRREAALLLSSQKEGAWLAGQGWGPDPLAAVALKQAALRLEERNGRPAALPLWRQLPRRFPGEPASADALYALGRDQPVWRQTLLHRFPAHPAALAAAVEASAGEAAPHRNTLHLARWGARWPGASEAISALCAKGDLSPASAARLARGLAEAGDGPGALRCLGQPAPQPARVAALDDASRLIVARALLKGSPEERRQAVSWLSDLARRRPRAPEAEEAVRLLSEREEPDTPALLQSLPPPWRDSAPVRARLASADPSGRAALEVLRRWPLDPASWDLQWELARRLLLAGQWEAVLVTLEALPADQLPPALAARHRFWHGYAQRQLGQEDAAIVTWKRLLLHHPGGYYGWRASLRLGREELALRQNPAEPLQAANAPPWQPLASGDAAVDALWRLGQPTEAWEAWRVRRGGQPPTSSADLLVEGRLRQAVGDDWTGLAQLERAALRLPPEQCDLLPQLERSLHPRRHLEALAPEARRQGLALPLLLGVAKQESRFTPAVQSAAGAVGLLQLMPATAAELAGAPLSTAALQDPSRNASLGARYLRGLLDQWQGEPLAAVASYNAGPGAVQGWTTPERQAVPEIWVEAIPFPETRLYVKKVLGNAWSYQRERRPAC
jgi:soluble lytic murein transglycosylase